MGFFPHFFSTTNTYRFNSMSDSHDELSLLPHGIDKLHGNHSRVVSLRELAGSTVQSSSESVALEKASF